MRKLQWFVVFVVALVAGAALVALREGWIQAPWGARYAELSAQLRDRGTVAVAGEIPLAMPKGEVTLAPVSRFPALVAGLGQRDAASAVDAARRARLDGLLVRTDAAQGATGSTLRALSELRAVRGFSAVYLDETAALYETADTVTITPEDAQRLVSVARLILSGAAAPPERLFPEEIRRTRPVEVALVVRDGNDPILWRSTRAGSIARAFLDVCFAVLDRWTSRQQERYGRLRDALTTKVLTVAVFYDKGVLGARTPAFLRRAADPRVWSVGYERLASWEYSLPPSPERPAPDPSEALRTLARDRGVPAPGYLRSELTLYRFRALQVIERAPYGPVEVFDPTGAEATVTAR